MKDEIYENYIKTHRKLRIDDILKLEKGDTIKLALYDWEEQEWIKFLFTLDKIKGKKERVTSVGYYIYGTSPFTGKKPLRISRVTQDIIYTPNVWKYNGKWIQDTIYYDKK